MRKLILSMLVVLFPVVAAAQVPATLGYQGRLLKADGTPESGVVPMTFRLFATETGGSAVWSEELEVAVSDGFYSVYLGEVNSLAGAFAGADRYLELTVGGSPLSPRQKVASVPYALRCETARNLAGGSVEASSLKVNGEALTTAAGKLEPKQLSGCPVPGTVLLWNGTEWTCQVPASGAVTVSAPLVGDGLATPLSLPKASASADGYLSSADWSAFEAKVASVGAATGGGLARSGSAGAPELGLMPCAANQVLRWSGSAWGCDDAADGTGGGYLQNQSVADQPATFRISGSGSMLGDLGVGTANPRARIDLRGAPALSGNGTIGATTDSTITVGGFTSFTTQVRPGDLILAVGQVRRVTAVTNDTQLTVDQAWNPVPVEAAFTILKPVARVDRHDGTLAAAVDGEGRVGIGTATPQAALDVVGDVHVSGRLTFASNPVQSSTIQAGGGTWGNWTTMQVCPKNTYACGVEVQRPPAINGGAGTELHGVKLACCAFGGP